MNWIDPIHSDILSKQEIWILEQWEDCFTGLCENGLIVIVMVMMSKLAKTLTSCLRYLTNIGRAKMEKKKVKSSSCRRILLT